MKRNILFILVILLMIGMSGCTWLCRHNWKEASCLTPKTCSKCNLTEGEALDHDWKEASCAAPVTCTRCAETIGQALAHTWEEANCTAPKTCSVCKLTEGEALGHTWKDATYKAPKTCEVCSATEGELLQSTGDEIDAELYKKLNGIWVDESSGYFMQYSKSKVTTGWLVSEYGPSGTIQKIEKTDSSKYNVTINFPKQTIFDGTYKGSTSSGQMAFSGSKKMVWTAGKTKTTFVYYAVKSISEASNKYLDKIYG